MRFALTRLLFVLAWVATLITVLCAVSFKSTVTLFFCLNDAVTTECLCTVLEAVELAIQLIQHCVQHLQKHIIIHTFSHDGKQANHNSIKLHVPL